MVNMGWVIYIPLGQRPLGNIHLSLVLRETTKTQNSIIRGKAGIKSKNIGIAVAGVCRINRDGDALVWKVDVTCMSIYNLIYT